MAWKGNNDYKPAPTKSPSVSLVSDSFGNLEHRYLNHFRTLAKF